MIDVYAYKHPIDPQNPIELFRIVKPRYLPQKGDVINHMGEGYEVCYIMHRSDRFGCFPIIAVNKL